MNALELRQQLINQKAEVDARIRTIRAAMLGQRLPPDVFLSLRAELAERQTESQRIQAQQHDLNRSLAGGQLGLTLAGVHPAALQQALASVNLAAFGHESESKT